PRVGFTGLSTCVRLTPQSSPTGDGTNRNESRHGTDEGSQDPDHKFLPDAPVGYGLSRGPDRHPEPSDRGSDRAFQRARQGSSFSPRPAEDGRDPPPPPGLPQGQERGALPRVDQEARDSQIGRHGDPGRPRQRAESTRTGWLRANLRTDSGEYQKGTLSSYLLLDVQSSLPLASTSSSLRRRPQSRSVVDGAFHKSPGAPVRPIGPQDAPAAPRPAQEAV